MRMDWVKLGIGCVKAARDALRTLQEVQVVKGGINVQTNADLQANEAIISYLKDQKIACTVYSEEETEPVQIEGGNPNIIFIIDPIDNTNLFLRGETHFCSVALMILIDDDPHYAFVGEVANDDIYYCDQKHAYLNGEKISIPAEISGRKILLAWAPYTLRINRLFDNLTELTEKDYFIYNFGGQLQTAKIGLGHYDAYLEVRGESLHEFCGALIAERAGAIVSTLKGEKIVYQVGKKQTLLVARTREIYEEILPYFKDKDY